MAERPLLSRVLLSCVLAAGLVLIPIVPAHAFFIGGVSLKDEKQMGRKFDAAVRARLPLVDDPEVRQYVADLLRRLVKAIPPQPFEFKAATILNNALNAFAVPGGYVYVFTGLIMNLNNEAELAGVLGHELAHVTQRHVASRLERAQFISLGALLAAVAGVAIGGPAAAAAAMTAAGAGQSAMLNYSRLDESEADNVGLQYLQKAGYPPEGLAGGFRVLRQKSKMAGAGQPPIYLSTHPAIGDRINTVLARVAAMSPAARKGRYDNGRFKRVQTLLWARYGDEQAALERFRGDDKLSLMGRGIVLSRMNRVKEAQQVFARAVTAAPDDALVLREAGIFHYRKGDLEQAEQLLTRAMRLDANDYMAHFFAGRLLDDAGQRREAQGMYRNVLRHVPEDAEVHDALARSYGQGGNNYLAHVHLAYAAMYANNKKLTERYLAQARKLANAAGDKKPLQRLETAYKERKEIWDKS